MKLPTPNKPKPEIVSSPTQQQILKRKKPESSKVICEFCNQEFEDLSEKSEHVNAEHGTQMSERLDDLYRCNICQKITRHKRELADHMNKHKNPEKFYFGCALCFELFSRMSVMNNHLLAVHKVPKLSIKYSCAHCSYQTENKRKLQCHIFRDHFSVADKPFKCDVCDLACNSYYSLLQHRHKDHGIDNAGYQFCVKCEFLTNKPNDMEKHCAKCKTNRFKEVLCTQCGFSCSSQNVLDLHEYLHSDIVEKIKDDEEIKAFCAICSFRSLCEADVLEHLEEHRERMSKKPVNCTRCDEMIQNYEHLLVHAKKHTARKDYRCLKCQQMFFNDRRFLLHIKKHMMKQTIFKCPQCPKEFKSKYGLKNHEDTIHSKVGILLCPTCGVT